MFKNDRMMLILTGLVLAIFAGSMVQYSDRIVAMMSGEDVVVTQDDSYSVRAGSSQILDVLSNDDVKGAIVVLTRPSCGAIEMSSNNRLSFSSNEECVGEVEFAYCVDNEGKCAPNAVKINVISVAFAQADAARADESAAAEAAINEQPRVAQAVSEPEPSFEPGPATEAPEIASFSVEMSPPALAVPDVTELVSPGVAVASIRRATGGLNTASATDQNIATQNSASINQTASSGPTTFAPPSIAESSNISLGGGSTRVVASTVTTPGGLQATSAGDSNIVQLERGPVALDSLQIAQAAPTAADVPPLSANLERNGDAPVFVASAQTNGPSLDTQFNAEPVDGGPIALIALNRTPTRGIAAGESLNIILAEPGLQSFKARAATPAALAPTSTRPTAVTVLERAPNIAEQLFAPAALPFSADLAVGLSYFDDKAITRPQLIQPVSVAILTPFSTVGVRVVASQPNQSSAPVKFSRHDTVSRFISMSQIDNSRPIHTNTYAALAAPQSPVFSMPSLNLRPADKPRVLEASLPIAPVVPTVTAPVQNSACDIALSASVRSGANITLDITAACKPNQMVTVAHAGLAFSVLTDAQGMASVLVPAMQSEAELSVTFQDQSTRNTTVSVRDISSVVRAGVSWQANMDLDLSAIEFGAAIGSEGHVTAATPRDYRTSRVKGGGYLLLLGDPSLERGALAEVYTLPTQRNQQRGTIAMSVVISDVAPVCGQTIAAKTVRTRDGRSAGIRNVRFSVPSCGTIVSGPIALPGAIDDIRLAGR